MVKLSKITDRHDTIMEILNKFKHVRLLRRLQEKKRNGAINKVTFNFLLQAGWSPANARRGLIRLNNIRLVDLARGQKLTPPTLQKTLLGERKHPLAMQLLSDSVKIPIHEFYPEEQNDPAHT